MSQSNTKRPKDFWIKNRKDLAPLYREGMTVVSLDEKAHATLFKLGIIDEISKTARHYPIRVTYTSGMSCCHDPEDLVPVSWYLSAMED